MRILIVEDEEKTALQLKRGLSELNITSDVSMNGLDALTLAEKMEYDMILLDVMLPGVDGWEVVKRLRAANDHTPVLFLTARDAVQDRVMGLQLGGDDYMVKPFAFSELTARIQTILRRGHDIQPDVLRVADLEVNFFAFRATRSGKRLDLTQKEFSLLALLMRHSGEVFTRSRIAERIWDMDFGSDMKVVDVHMRNLRAKVDDPFEPKLLHTVRGVGYVLEER
ncbi:heavy metal response regulator transcription factor [Geomonas sp. RF6]|uniref:heavy metal response regulator transcription factor n=1 Tax=Geomonas sp. RF6 TaxID=2897342 RepID=UPI001E51D768|nr:heavy metal response regulator transcription factor [Geomonas sp. RF6]UFS72764.1 heavy metal response regulator transcription factor [Geomonas sp. RF6]